MIVAVHIEPCYMYVLGCSEWMMWQGPLFSEMGDFCAVFANNVFLLSVDMTCCR